MRIQKHVFLPLLLIILVIGCTSKSENTNKKYKYGLTPIHSSEDYIRSMESNPEFRLVNLESVLTHADYDIRYATSNNFTSEIIYPKARAFAILPVAEALKAVEDSLEQIGLSLLIYDAYRPYSATMKFYEVYKDTNYVASPFSGSRHNRGCAVDVSLATLDGLPLQMPTEYDDFSSSAHPFEPLNDSLMTFNRSLLQGVMLSNGFDIYPYEWWHFDFKGWEEVPIMDFSFAQLDSLN